MRGYDAREMQLMQDVSAGVPNADLRLRDYREAKSPPNISLGEDTRKILLPGAFIAIIGIAWIVEAVRREGQAWPWLEPYAFGIGLSVGIAWFVMAKLFDDGISVLWRFPKRATVAMLMFVVTEWPLFALTADRTGLGYATLKWYGVALGALVAFVFVAGLVRGSLGVLRYFVKHPLKSIVLAGLTLLAVRILLTLFGIGLPAK